MMPGFRHANRKTKMHSKREMCFYLNTGHDHSSTAHKVLLASGVASYTADVTFGYYRWPFVGESPTRGDGAVVSSLPSPQQPQLMGAGGAAGAVEHQRARPQQQQRPSHSMGAVGGAGEVEHQRARPQQEKRPPHSMGAGGGVGGGAGAVEPHLMGTGGGAGAMLPPYLNGSRGRGRSGGDTATAAVVAAGVGTVGGDRRSGCGDFGDGPVDTGSRRAHRRWNHSRRGVWSRNGGGDINEGAAGAPGGAVVFARTATAAGVPCDTGGHEIKSTATGSIKDVYASYGGGGYRADSRPAGRSPL